MSERGKMDKDILVKTGSPKALDDTVNQLGGVVMQDGPDNYFEHEDGVFVVRSLNGNSKFLKFAISKQGYGEVVGETDKYQNEGQ